MTLRAMLKYRHKWMAWVGTCEGEYVVLFHSAPVA